MRAWAGPLSLGFIEKQFELQKKILQRYAELGIQAVLPGFNGVVPQQMVQYSNNDNIRN